MYTLYKFHFLNGISEINQLFDDILIIWPAPVYIYTVYFTSSLFITLEVEVQVKCIALWETNTLLHNVHTVHPICPK